MERIHRHSAMILHPNQPIDRQETQLSTQRLRAPRSMILCLRKYRTTAYARTLRRYSHHAVSCNAPISCDWRGIQSLNVAVTLNRKIGNVSQSREVMETSTSRLETNRHRASRRPHVKIQPWTVKTQGLRSTRQFGPPSGRRISVQMCLDSAGF